MSVKDKVSSPQAQRFREQYEDLRHTMTKAALPAEAVAFSIDGRVFGFEVPVSQSIRVGAYVTINTDSGIEYLGQITSQEIGIREGPEYGLKFNAETQLMMITKSTAESNFVERVRLRYVHGRGELIGRVTQNGIERATDQDVFEQATLKLASTDTIALHLSTSQKELPGLDIGYSLGAQKGKARVQLQPKGFRRHTFMCGQSRSGKTFALGVILEQILLSETSQRLIIIDPNSDFVRLNELLTKKEHDDKRHEKRTDDEFAAIKKRYEEILPAIRILRPYAGDPLRIRLSDLNRYEQGAVLQLHPIHDLQAFNSFAKVIEGLGEHLYSWEVINNRLSKEFSASAVDLALRIQNLSVSDWDVWCKTEEPSITQQLMRDDWRFMVVDVGTLASAEQRAVANLAVLNYLWKTKNRETPVLLVLDEAHNICPFEPSTPMEEIATDYVIRIAGEGIKYGLRLLLASQRPAKIHPNVLTQCENLVLMRMNSKADLEGLSPIFSQVDPALLAQARYFVQGESLIVGEIVKSPTFAKFEGRITREGGGDAPNV